MGIFLASFVSYWIGWFVYRRVYKAELARRTRLYQEAIDQMYDKIESEVQRFTFAIYLSDVKLKLLLAALPEGSLEYRVILNAMRRRGLAPTRAM